ncbi:MAG: glycosyltransferase [Thermoplasmatales archaeon]
MLNETTEPELVGEDQADPLLMRTFSIIIPAYNEEKRIDPTLEEITDFIWSNRLPWNVIVCIDGTDGTEKIVKEYARKYPFIEINSSNGRSGKGNAIRRALPVSSEYTILMDADNSVLLSSILKTIPLLSDSDIVILSRYGNRDNRIPLFRRFLSRGFNLLMRTLLGLNITDTQSGYKIFRTKYLVEAMKKVTVTTGFYDVSLLYHAIKKGAKVKEVSVVYNHRDGSSYKTIFMIIDMGISLIAFSIAHSRYEAYIPYAMKKLYYRKFRWI